MYLHFHNTYGYQAWQGSGLMWGTPPIKSRDLLIMWSREKWKTLYLHFHYTDGHLTCQGIDLKWVDLSNYHIDS